MNDEPLFYRAGVDVPEDVTRLVIGGVTVVGGGLFRGHRNLVWVELREGVLKIGRDAFRDCRHLRRVDCPSSLRTIVDGAFDGCWSLSETNLPEGLQHIGRAAFWGHCFEQITIPSSVVDIGDLAFATAKGEVLSKVTLAGRTVMVARDAFAGCRQLRNIRTPSEVIVVEDGEYGNGRAAAASGGTIARQHLGLEPMRLILASPYLTSMQSEDVTRVKDAIDRIAGAGRIHSRFLGLLSVINRTIGGRSRWEGPLDLGAGNVDDWIRVREGADGIRSCFLGLLSAHRGAIASILERAPLWESEKGRFEPGVVRIILSFLGDVEG